ncbi:unnamed protein product [Pleuronectes platessa]|uniref:Uncharacterized protein n=1 Tax=Pleuronectes platessa TaxID=8262 RepID=A0A9N7YQW5_PLEPL|nr:unnamed protein product [Pleuronectes platessa]
MLDGCIVPLRVLHQHGRVQTQLGRPPCPQSQTSPMSVWLPAKPEGTKDHRELSSQRGTDMSFSPSPSQHCGSPMRNTLCAAEPAGPASAAKSISSSRPVQMQLSEGQILYSSYRKRGVYPRMQSSLQLWS